MPTQWLTHKRLMVAVVLALAVCSMLPGPSVDLVGRVPAIIVETLTNPPIAVAGMIVPDLRETQAQSVVDGATRRQLQRRYQEALADNQNLRERLREQKAKYQALKGAKARLPEQVNVDLAVADVTGLSESTTNPVLTIAGGRNKGIRKDQVAVFHGNLVGRVVQVSPVTARVRLIVATETSLGVKIKPANTAGPREVPLRLQWDEGQAVFTAEPDQHQTIKRGDVAMLNDDAWPLAAQGYIVGKVTRVQPHPKKPWLQRARVKPLTPLKQLDRVIVIVPKQ
jgi:cell shape-determining protein MreC